MTYYGEANYYELLEISPRATRAEIDRAHRQQMMLLSGDSLATYGLFVGDDLIHARTRVEEAHRVLTDPERRRAYDLEQFNESIITEADVARAASEAAVQAVRAGTAGGAGARGRETEAAVGETPSEMSPERSDEVTPEIPVDVASGDSESSVSRPDSPPGQVRMPASPPPSVTFRSPSPAADAAKTGDSGRSPRPEAPQRPPASRPIEPQARPMEPQTRPTDSPSRPVLPGWRNPVPGAQPEGAGVVPTARASRPAPRVVLETFDGPAMRVAREQQGIARTAIATRTRISEFYIEAIEQEEFKKLPPEIYLRGYLRQYAEAIGVDPDKAVTEFMARYNGARGGGR
ncbi:MAG: helix-turn-helix domain-containing protein [Nitrospirota bacterium]|nr:helix-turn-helix domain-containing protein [Nitrospirota bacterium]